MFWKNVTFWPVFFNVRWKDDFVNLHALYSGRKHKNCGDFSTFGRNHIFHWMNFALMCHQMGWCCMKPVFTVFIFPLLTFFFFKKKRFVFPLLTWQIRVKNHPWFSGLRILRFPPKNSQNRPQSTLFKSNQSALYVEFFHDLGIEDVLHVQENKLVK